MPTINQNDNPDNQWVCNYQRIDQTIISHRYKLWFVASNQLAGPLTTMSILLVVVFFGNFLAGLVAEHKILLKHQCIEGYLTWRGLSGQPVSDGRWIAPHSPKIKHLVTNPFDRSSFGIFCCFFPSFVGVGDLCGTDGQRPAWPACRMWASAHCTSVGHSDSTSLLNRGLSLNSGSTGVTRSIKTSGSFVGVLSPSAIVGLNNTNNNNTHWQDTWHKRQSKRIGKHFIQNKLRLSYPSK